MRVNVGDHVSGQTVIGKTGSTGPQGTQPHLHFEVINPTTSDLISAGISLGDSKIKGQGREENPCQYLSQAFPQTFPTRVDARDGGYDISGDQRDNSLVGNSRDNIMTGGQGFDTYYVNFGDTISDSDGTGRIVIDNGSQSIVLQGNAIPLKDSQGNIIPNQWFLNGYNLIRNGDNLVIFAAGDDISSSATPRITIANFPFDSQGISFGLTLGKTLAPDHDTSPTYGETIIDEDTQILGNGFRKYFLRFLLKIEEHNTNLLLFSPTKLQINYNHYV